MNKHFKLLAMAIYLVAVLCMLINPVLVLFEERISFENTVLMEKPDFTLTVYNLLSFGIATAAIIFLMVFYHEMLAASYIAVTSLLISGAIGVAMLYCWAERKEMSEYVIFGILVIAANVLEIKLKTWNTYEFLAAFWHSFSGMLAYLHVLDKLEIPMLSPEAWFFSFFFGLIVSIQTSYLRVPHKSSNLKATKKGAEQKKE